MSKFSFFYKQGNHVVEDDLPKSIVIRSCLERVISAIEKVEITMDTCKVQKAVAAVKISVKPMSYEMFF